MSEREPQEPKVVEKPSLPDVTRPADVLRTAAGEETELAGAAVVGSDDEAEGLVLPLPPSEAEQQARHSFRTLQEHFRLGHWQEIPKHDFALLYVFRALLQTGRQLVSDAVFARASSLAFFSVLAMVPLFVVVGSLFLMVGDNPVELVADVRDYLLPVAGAKITEYIVEAVARAADSSLGPIGALALIVSSVALFLQIERVFNDIWRVQRRRPFWIRVLFFYSALTVGPLLLSFSIYQATRLSEAVEGYGVAGSLLSNSVVWLLSGLTFSLAFALLPNTRVSWRAAAVAALTTAIFFEVAKWGFQLYVSSVFTPGYSAIYGAIGLIPVFLVWVYVSWLVVLFGAELSYCIQNLRWLMVQDKVARKLEATAREVFVGSSLLAAEVFAAVTRGFVRGDVPVPIEVICAESGYPLPIALEVMRRLERARLAIKVEVDEREGYMPARPLEEIGLVELLELFEVPLDKPEFTPELRRIAQRYAAARKQALARQTARDLARLLPPQGS